MQNRPKRSKEGVWARAVTEGKRIHGISVLEALRSATKPHSLLCRYAAPAKPRRRRDGPPDPYAPAQAKGLLSSVKCPRGNDGVLVDLWFTHRNSSLRVVRQCLHCSPRMGSGEGNERR